MWPFLPFVDSCACIPVSPVSICRDQSCSQVIQVSVGLLLALGQHLTCLSWGTSPYHCACYNGHPASWNPQESCDQRSWSWFPHVSFRLKLMEFRVVQDLNQLHRGSCLTHVGVRFLSLAGHVEYLYKHVFVFCLLWFVSFEGEHWLHPGLQLQHSRRYSNRCRYW